MAQIRIACLVPRTNKAGITSWYWQPSKTLKAAGWRAEALGKDEGAAIARAREINAEVDLWKSGGARPKAVAPRRASGTLGALIARYRNEVVNGKKPDGSDRLKATTRAGYETALARLEQWAGKHPLAYITPARVRALRDAGAKPVAQGGLGHAATLALLKTGRQIFAFAERVDLTPRGSNPFANFELGAVPARRIVWELDDDAAFDAAARELGYPGMALAREIALFSAQRRNDLIAFTEAQFAELDIFDRQLRDHLAGEDGKVFGWSMEQGKTSNEYSSRRMRIPFSPELAGRVAWAIRHNRARDRAADPPRLLSHVLVDDTSGLPWKPRHFTRVVTRILDHAAKRTGRPHMRDLHWHDLRRTRVVRLRWKGMGKEMIASITGHDPKSIDEMLKVYGPIDPTTTAAAIVNDLAQRA